MIIKVLGSGCAKCRKLEENARLAAAGMDAVVQKISDINQITNYGVMLTPALVIDEKVVSTGKVLSPEKIKEFFKNQVKI